MIVKDEMTAVLVKMEITCGQDGHPRGIRTGEYLDAYMEDNLNGLVMDEERKQDEEKVHQEQDGWKHGWAWENKGKDSQHIWGVWQITGMQEKERDTWGMR